MSSTLDQLVRRRTAIKSTVKRIEKQVAANGTTPLNATTLSKLADDLKKQCTWLDTIQASIYEQCVDDAHIEAQEEIANQVEESIQSLRDQVQVLLDPLLPVVPHSSSSSSSHASIKLPEIKLPHFDGKFENWSPYQDLFIATIHKNKALSGAQKLQYLKTTLSGEPANLIKTLQVTDTNYKQAWDMLEARYNNQREIITSIIKRLFGQPSLTSESSLDLQNLIDTTNECIRALAVLGRPVDTWDDFLIVLVVERMDNNSRREWAKILKGTDMPVFQDLSNFLDQHIRGLQAGASTATTSTTILTQQEVKQSNNSKIGGFSKKSTSSYHGTTSASCPHCKDQHQIYQCEKFAAASTAERNRITIRLKLCFNCLKPNHSLKECKSSNTCKLCNRKHNTLLHMDKPQSGNHHQNSNYADKQVLFNSESRNTQVLLATALVTTKDNSGINQTCRLLLDSGSQATFISERCVKGLGLKRTKSNVSITGIASTKAGIVRGQVQLILQSCVNEKSLEIEAFILPKVTGILPKFQFSHQHWNHIKGLPLADPSFHKPGQIDILLGADYAASIMEIGQHSGSNDTAIAQKTIFGWILSGKVKTGKSTSIHVNHCNIEEILQKFWELEEMPTTKHLSPEENLCEKHFMENYKRDPKGRYIVSLPFKSNITKMGLSRESAIKRLKQVENRLESLPTRKQEYHKFMQEFQDLHHMEKIPDSELNQQQGNYYYLPHHFVLKPSSTSTKFRVVFDGSAKTSTGISLNDCLMVGATIQDDLTTLLLRFRTHIIALKADISKFYRQFQVADNHKDFQRIVWRNSQSDPIQDFRLVRVTYGTAAGAFLATRSVHQLSKDEGSKYPTAARVLTSDFYVDDLLSGESTPEKAVNLQRELSALLRLGGMEICKWTSNSSNVLQSIPIEDREADLPLSFDRDNCIKALGVQWQPASDNFSFMVIPPSVKGKITKRVVLSELAKVFDPLGFLSPTTILAKILFQDLWKLNLSWDEELPSQILQQWNQYYHNLKIIGEINIPRCITNADVIKQEFHGFCDASEKAYGAVVYIRNLQSNGNYDVKLITSKTKVAPIKQVSLPRLELNGAVMLSNLLIIVRNSTQIKADIFAWTDSTVVLHWLDSSPSRWKKFVANRVAEIQDLLPVQHWNHVISEQNPADCASRGISASDLKESKLWWHGPEWLHHHGLPKPFQNRGNITAASYYSSLLKLKRVTAYCFRFINNCRKNRTKTTGTLTCSEIQFAFQHWIRYTQESEFEKEIKALKSSSEVSIKSKLKSLYPYIDSTGIIRVGGRLENAKIPDNQKHQIILPAHHHLTTLIIQSHHITHLHANAQLLLAVLQEQFWIIRGRDTIRHIIRRCVICRRHRADNAQQLMGALPTARVNPGKPFQHCGVDYAGPFNLREFNSRGKKWFKGYICVFVCLATKAIHLEAVSDMTTDSFIAALKRFGSRRGLSTAIYSDCGTNFIGADTNLKKMLKSEQHNTQISDHCSSRGITWHFNPPAAPHHGGLWEAGVKSVKYHLRRVVGTSTLNFEEFQTLLCQIEACLNSRPLCATSTDPADYTALTPGHFLIGHPLTAVPEGDLTPLKINRLSRWQFTQQLLQHFWKRWSAEYLSTLQQRFKWTAKRDNIQINDLVLIKDELQPPMKWKMGRIVQIHPGQDQHVRVVTVKTSTSEFKRPISKLCPLIQHDDNN